MYNMDTKEQFTCVALMVFRGELIRRIEVEVRERKLKNGTAVGKD